MYKVYFSSQNSFEDGRTMCSVASVLACVYILGTKKNILTLESSTFEFLMKHSNILFRTRFKRVGQRLFDVHDVISRIDLRKRFKEIVFSEFGGLTQNTPSDMKTDDCLDLSVFLQMIQDGDACTLTFKGHTNAFGKVGCFFWFFDSLDGIFAVSESKRFLLGKFSDALVCSDEYSAVVLKRKTTST